MGGGMDHGSGGMEGIGKMMGHRPRPAIKPRLYRAACVTPRQRNL